MDGLSWPFDQGPNVVAIASRNVIFPGAPVLVVVHHSDDHSWGFLDGGPAGYDDAALVSTAQAVERDATLRDVADLPPGGVATRERIGAPWLRDRDDPV